MFGDDGCEFPAVVAGSFNQAGNSDDKGHRAFPISWFCFALLCFACYIPYLLENREKAAS